MTTKMPLSDTEALMSLYENYKKYNRMACVSDLAQEKEDLELEIERLQEQLDELEEDPAWQEADESAQKANEIKRELLGRLNALKPHPWDEYLPDELKQFREQEG